MWKKEREQEVLIRALKRDIDKLESNLKYCESQKNDRLHDDRLIIDYRSLQKKFDELKLKEMSGELVDLTVKYITAIKPLINKV
jgi:hypothetical protein